MNTKWLIVGGAVLVASFFWWQSNVQRTSKFVPSYFQGSWRTPRFWEKETGRTIKITISTQGLIMQMGLDGEKFDPKAYSVSSCVMLSGGGIELSVSKGNTMILRPSSEVDGLWIFSFTDYADVGIDRQGANVSADYGEGKIPLEIVDSQQ